jgi:hypothetical protein
MYYRTIISLLDFLPVDETDEPTLIRSYTLQLRSILIRHKALLLL